MGAANLFLVVFYPSRPSTDIRRVLAAFSVVQILLVVSLADVLLTSYFRWDPSGRTLSDEIRRSGIPSRGLLVRSMSRGQRYSLSFYLHDEVTDWDVEHPREGYILLGGRYCRDAMGPGLTCREIPFDQEKTGFFLYRIKLQSSGSLPRSGEPQ